MNMNYDPNIHHRRSIRLEGYDYSQEGLYFVTICTEKRDCLFGDIFNGEMVLNEMGMIAYHEWLETPVIRKNVGLDVFVVMPNHIHGIIIIKEAGCGGELNSPFNNPMNNIEEGVCNTPLHSPSQTIGSIVRGYKASVTGKINALKNTKGIVVWQSNYWEHIIRDEGSYSNISEYIINNAFNWNTDKLFIQ
jgi:putative transposase